MEEQILNLLSLLAIKSELIHNIDYKDIYKWFWYLVNSNVEMYQLYIYFFIFYFKTFYSYFFVLISIK